MEFILHISLSFRFDLQSSVFILLYVFVFPNERNKTFLLPIERAYVLIENDVLISRRDFTKRS